MALEWTHSVADLSDRTCVFHSEKYSLHAKTGTKKTLVSSQMPAKAVHQRNWSK